MQLPIAGPSHRSGPPRDSLLLTDTTPEPYQTTAGIHESILQGPPPQISVLERESALLVLSQWLPSRDTFPGNTPRSREPSRQIPGTPFSSILPEYEPWINSTAELNTGVYFDGPLPTDPLPHTRPLYSHIPLPDEHIALHEELRYSSSSELNTYLTSPLGPWDNWSEPATVPTIPLMTITLSPTMECITVYPHPPATGPDDDIVRVGDIQLAIEDVMSRLETTDHTCITRPPLGLERQIAGRRCICKSDVAAFEYLRQRYGSAGLLEAVNYPSDWVFHLG